MRIVIDYQGAQSPSSANRGIGRYTSSLVQAIARQAGQHELVLVLNGLFADSVDDAKARFKGLVDPENVHVWYPPARFEGVGPGGQRAKEKLYETFIASLRPDVVFVSSLFEGLSDASVTSVGSFVSLPTAVTLYDLIPLINPKPYLDNPAVRNWYMRKVVAMRRASMWFAISESSRQEGIDHLGLDPERCINVSTAAYDHFKPLDIASAHEQALRARYGLHKPFVMYTGGIDHRKNLEGLIRAFALLPPEIRREHQLAIVCSARPEDRSALLELARTQQLADGDVVVTGFVPEQDLVDLYNLCTLFVFPSWHEGFGLPALEAMHCGAVVIGANTSSLPEVIGCAEALFDPRSDQAIAAKMLEALTDESFRARLIEHGLRQAGRFTWDESARRALEGLEALGRSSARREMPAAGFRRLRPRMAYVSPLPPQRSGIAIYSADLLPELAQHYEIDLIASEPGSVDPMLRASFPIRDIQWLRDNASAFDRVVYQFGNSEAHQHMFDLLAEIPGVVVLHDFYLSGIQAHREFQQNPMFCWTQSLYESHGYAAVAERFQAPAVADVIFRYPCNFDVLTQAQGVIVHSPHSVELAQQWFGERLAKDWALIPLLRVPPSSAAAERAVARAELGLRHDDFLVCAFGFLGPTKLNHRLLDAWLSSSLSKDAQCRLVFVGENEKSPYGTQIGQRVEKEGASRAVSITGWTSLEVFHRYLAAADLAVQLRTQSRGETSATVLDAMGRGLATIVNANGSMAYLPTDAVSMLPDDFADAELVHALEHLRRDPQTRENLGRRGEQVIRSNHAPRLCANGYAEAIERFAARAAIGRDGLLQAIGDGDPLADSARHASEMSDIAEAIAGALPEPMPQAQLFVDVSELVQRDSRSGIQRVVKSLLRALLEAPPAGFRTEPVYAVEGRAGYRYARRFTLGFMDCPEGSLADAPIDARRGDVFVGLDLQPHLIPRQQAFFRRLRHSGVRVEFVVYDLLPMVLKNRFSDEAAAVHTRWLTAVSENDGALCISQSVADELKLWLAEHAPERLAEGFRVQAFPLGADLEGSLPTKGLPRDARKTRQSLATAPSFLMVGTVEPRKGHALVLDAFEQLWASGRRINLVVAGKQGWMVDDIAKRLRRHPQKNQSLFWLEKVSDEYLEELYAAASCQIAASEGEGFGLPLIEGAKHKLPLLARDLPVFREVAGAHASFFEGNTASLVQAIPAWLELFERGTHPRSEGMPYLSWRQSADAFKAALLRDPGPGSATSPVQRP